MINADILAEYQLVTSVHVYSLAPHPQRDLTLLSEATRSLSEYTNKEDAVTAAKKYGIIVNPQLRCRKRPAQLKAPPPPASKPNVKQETTTAKPAQMTKVKQEVADAPSKNSTPTSSASKPTAPTLKRGSSGGIMQSFAKASALPPRVKSTVKKHKEDAHAALSDDGEADDSDIPPTKKVLVDANAVRNSRQQREDELRRMMEEDDDGDDDNDEEAQDNEDDPADEEMEDGPEQEPEPDSVSGSKEDKEAVEMVSSTRDGRRRGKRRVMKKKRIVDDQGYMGMPCSISISATYTNEHLVTIQEAGWESFSEDETPAVSAKKETSTPTSSSGNAKAKKPAAKGAQGNIMSFFAKK